MEDKSKVDIRFLIQSRSSSLFSGHVSVGTCCTSDELGFCSANVVVVGCVGNELDEGQARAESVVSTVGALEREAKITEDPPAESAGATLVVSVADIGVEGKGNRGAS